MSDIIFKHGDTNASKKLKDMGDGTYAEVVYTGGGTGGGGGGGGTTRTPSYSFLRTADANPYSTDDIIANSVTAGSVVPLSWTVTGSNNTGGQVRRARVKVSDITNYWNGVIRVHLYTVAPTMANGDNGAYPAGTALANYIGYIDVTLDEKGSDYTVGESGPTYGTEINFVTGASDTKLYGILSWRGAGSTPNVSASTFITELEVVSDS